MMLNTKAAIFGFYIKRIPYIFRIEEKVYKARDWF